MFIEKLYQIELIPLKEFDCKINLEEKEYRNKTEIMEDYIYIEKVKFIDSQYLNINDLEGV